MRKIDLETTITAAYQSLAAPVAFAAALTTVYQSAMTDTFKLTDYTGLNNIALNTKWQQLSADANSASKIVNLIWTDIAATATVGTKSTMSKIGMRLGAQRVGPATPASVTTYSKKLHYDYRYGIPAALVLLIALLVAIALLLCLLFRVSYRESVQLLNQTSTGRAVLNLLDPNSGVVNASTKDWVVAAGGTKLQYPFYRACKVVNVTEPMAEVSIGDEHPDPTSHDGGKYALTQTNRDRIPEGDSLCTKRIAIPGIKFH